MPLGSRYSKAWYNPDKSTGCTRIIGETHALIHERCFYQAQYNGAFLITTPILFELRVPANVEMHLKTIEIWSTGLGAAGHKIEIIENVSLTTGATAIIPRSKHRGGASPLPDDSVIIVKSNPSSIVTTNSIFLETRLFGSDASSGQSRSGDGASFDDEWILEEGVHLIRFTSSQDGLLSATLKWYELAD